MANNIEDSEDPGQDSYASPDRQLPFSMSGGDNGARGAPGMQQSYVPSSAGQGDNFRSPPTESRSRIATMANGDASNEQQQNNVTPTISLSKKPLFGKSTVLKTVSASKPSMFNSGAKASGGGAGLFKKPGMMGLGKKKF